MPEQQKSDSPQKASIPTLEQVSSGGVAFRSTPSGLEVALISVGKPARRQVLEKAEQLIQALKT